MTTPSKTEPKSRGVSKEEFQKLKAELAEAKSEIAELKSALGNSGKSAVTDDDVLHFWDLAVPGSFDFDWESEVGHMIKPYHRRNKTAKAILYARDEIEKEGLENFRTRYAEKLASREIPLHDAAGRCRFEGGRLLTERDRTRTR